MSGFLFIRDDGSYDYTAMAWHAQRRAGKAYEMACRHGYLISKTLRDWQEDAIADVKAEAVAERAKWQASRPGFLNWTQHAAVACCPFLIIGAGIVGYGFSTF